MSEQQFNSGEGEGPPPVPDHEYGGAVDPVRGNVRLERFSGYIEVGGLSFKFRGNVEGPSSLAVLWFGTAGGIAGGIVWAASSPGAGLAIIVTTLIVIVLYLVTSRRT